MIPRPKNRPFFTLSFELCRSGENAPPSTCNISEIRGSFYLVEIKGEYYNTIFKYDFQMDVMITGNVFQGLDLSSTIVAVSLLVVGWFLKFYFDKYFLFRPKLYLTMNGPLYGQKFIDYEDGHELTWRYECVLKNNSNFDSFNIKISEQKLALDKGGVISNEKEIKKLLRTSNHLSSKDSIEFEIKKTIRISSDVLIKSKIVDGVREVFPGSKVQNPDEELKPAVLNDFSLIISYENEKGKSLYTKFKKKNGFETNTFYFFRYPFLF